MQVLNKLIKTIVFHRITNKSIKSKEPMKNCNANHMKLLLQIFNDSTVLIEVRRDHGRPEACSVEQVLASALQNSLNPQHKWFGKHRH